MKKVSNEKKIADDFFNAILDDDISKIKELLTSGVDINIKDKNGRTPLINSIIEKKIEVIKLLINNNSDINVQDNDGLSALHFAVRCKLLNICELLIKNNAFVDIQDNHGNTPLSDAVFNFEGKGDYIKLLSSSGADKYLKNKYGVTPYEIAEDNEDERIIKFFK